MVPPSVQSKSMVTVWCFAQWDNFIWYLFKLIIPTRLHLPLRAAVEMLTQQKPEDIHHGEKQNRTVKHSVSAEDFLPAPVPAALGWKQQLPCRPQSWRGGMESEWKTTRLTWSRDELCCNCTVHLGYHTWPRDETQFWTYYLFIVFSD